MNFSSLSFYAFFAVLLLVYFKLRDKQWISLLFFSYFFYAWWRTDYLLLIIFSTLVDYGAAIALEKSKGLKRKFWLSLSLATNLGLLFTFKYLDFFSQSSNQILKQFNIESIVFPEMGLLPVVGISFYTFQTLSYTIDVYRGERNAERHLGKFALYVSFFPQLVAGPIERSSHLLPQFFKVNRWNQDNFSTGLQRIILGLVKKVIIADHLGLLVDMVYNNPTEHSGLEMWIATYAFSLQIYCDFSGYSDIAIGLSQIMGFSLMENFRRPYLANSIQEFWHRWHISLSGWFKDYLYIPLGGNKKGRIRTNFNKFIVFFLCGLWHGPSWNFIIWGCLHGVALAIERKLNLLKKANNLMKVFITFQFCTFTWIFFRADTLENSFDIIERGFKKFSLNHFHLFFECFSLAEMALLTIVFTFLGLRSYFLNQNISIQWFDKWKPLAYALGLNLVIFFHLPDRSFIYFQF